VSSNYLARVCQHLNVPYPHRGYWAKLQFRKAPKRPPLPEPRPGEVLEWEKGDAVPRQARTVVPAANDRVASRQKPSLEKRPTRHQLIAGVRESFEKCRLSEVGYLRPFKRNLVDIFVSNDTLTYAIDTANELFLRLEERGHRVMLAIDQYCRRPELRVYEGQKFDYYNREAWCLGRDTIVFVGSVAFGLTLYEATEYIETTYQRAPVVAALQALRGVKFLTAVGLVAELGDLRRFRHPRELMAYLGLVPSEYSSGPTVRRGAITKAGNPHVRRLLAEAAWADQGMPRIGRQHPYRQEALPKIVCDIAWQAQLGLTARFRRLVARGKAKPKVATAIARELVGFIWAITREVAPAQ
jgi:Transposase IS116/IS110/IS902 family